MTVAEIYNDKIKPRSARERLELARMILENIPPQAVVDYSEQWSDEDLRDFARAGWSRAEEEREHATAVR